MFCVAATANYLRMNLYIFGNLGGKAVIIQQQSAIEKATKGLFLRFTRKPNGTGHENHYNAIVDMESIPFYPIKNEDKSKPSTLPTTALSESTPVSAINIKTGHRNNSNFGSCSYRKYSLPSNFKPR